MIKLHDLLISFINTKRDNLTYMTHREYDKEGAYTKACQSRIETGTNWAGEDNSTLEFNNNPVNGFKIVGSVSRWSTQNKLIRVEDPRGFIVEVPTENLTTLLQHCNVNHGTVEQDCVWGKEGSSHILLPTNSDIYKNSVKLNNVQSGRVNFSELAEGDVVKFNADDKKSYIYLGKGKAVWSVLKCQASLYPPSYRHWGDNSYIKSPVDPSEIIGEFTDTKYCHLFKPLLDKEYSRWEYKATGKAVVVDKVKPDRGLVKGFSTWMPDRVERVIEDTYKLGCHVNSTGEYMRYDTKGFIWKK